jgi:hypothetical protein
MENNAENRAENKRSLRRLTGIGIWVVSMGIGLLVSLAIVFVWLNTDMDRFGLKYFLMVAFSVGIILVIWLDYFLDTKILPD